MQHYVEAVDAATARRVCGLFRRFHTEHDIIQTTGLTFGQVRKALVDNFNKSTRKKGAARSKAWDKDEDATLKRCFKQFKRTHRDGSGLTPQGWLAVAVALPGRSADACRSRADRIGLKFGWMNLWR